VVPGINDGKEDIEAFAEYLGGLRPRAVELLPYHPIGAEKYRRLGTRYELAETPRPSAAGLTHFCDVLSQAGLVATVGGES
jgi:pyruvate formate lyase activating enzyme